MKKQFGGCRRLLGGLLNNNAERKLRHTNGYEQLQRGPNLIPWGISRQINRIRMRNNMQA
jgi:hypothetical protein